MDFFNFQIGYPEDTLLFSDLSYAIGDFKASSFSIRLWMIPD